jgi:hypothetical protein
MKVESVNGKGKIKEKRVCGKLVGGCVPENWVFLVGKSVCESVLVGE